MPLRRGGICGRLAHDLPSFRLQGVGGEEKADQASHGQACQFFKLPVFLKLANTSDDPGQLLIPLPSQEGAARLKRFEKFTPEPRPESGLDCLTRAEFWP